MLTALTQRLAPDLLAHPASMQVAILGFGAVLLSMLGFSVMTLPVLVQLVVLVSVMVVLFFFTRPENSLLVFFALRAIFDLLWWVPGKVAGLNMLEMFTGAVTALSAVLFILEFRRIDRNPCLPAFIPFMVTLAIAGVRNLELRSGVEILARFASPLLIMFLTAAFFRRKELRRNLFVVITAVMVVPILTSLYHLGTGQMSSYALSGYNRLLGGYKNLHNHGLMMMTIACIGTWWLLRIDRKVDRYRWAAVALYTGGALTCLYFTYIRTGIIGLVAFVGTYLFVTGRRQYLGWAVAAAALFVLTSDTMQDRFQDIVLIFSDDQIALNKRKLGSGRWGLWSSSMAEYLRQPLGDIALGLGLGGHWLLTRDFYNPYALAQQGFVDPHSDYLTLMYQLGPIALISYIFMQFQVVKYGIRLNAIGRDAWAREFGAFMVALTATAVCTTAISNAFIQRTTLGWYYWGLAGIMFAEYFWEVDRRAKEPKGPRPVPESEAPPPAPQLPPRGPRRRRPALPPMPGMLPR